MDATFFLKAYKVFLVKGCYILHNSWIVEQSVEPWFVQDNPWIAPIHILRITFILAEFIAVLCFTVCTCM